jgi:hypothetical protein
MWHLSEKASCKVILYNCKKAKNARNLARTFFDFINSNEK